MMPRVLRKWYMVVGVPMIAISSALLILFALPRESAANEGLRAAVRVVRNYDYPWIQPNVSWEATSLGEQGIDSAKLDTLIDDLDARNTGAFLVIKGGKIVYEWYGPRSGPNTRQSVASLAKSLVGSMILLLALDSGRMELGDFAWQYIPQWQSDPERSRITIQHLATHSSGIEDVYFGGPNAQLEGWKQTYYENPDDRFSMALSRAPLEFTPGERYAYSGVGYYALAYALATSFSQNSALDMKTVLNDRIMIPLGIPEEAWTISYGQSYDVDGMNLYAIGSGGRYTPRSLARIGQFMLNRGYWEGQQLVDPTLVDAMVGIYKTQSDDSASGEIAPASALGWWINQDQFWPSLPRDAFVGAGADHQVLLVVPSLDLVMVRMGGSMTGTHWGGNFWDELELYLFKPLMDSVDAPD